MPNETPSPQAILDFLASGDNLPSDAPYGTGRGELERRYQSMGALRRARGGIQNTINSMPLVRNIPGIDTIISPQYDTQTVREARPFLSGVESHLGNAIPFAALGSGPYFRSAGELIDVPPILFGSVPRSMISTGGIAALDAYGAGENVQDAFVSGAAAGAIPAAVTKAITPRSLQGASNVNARAIKDADTLQSGAIPQGLDNRLNPFAYERRGALGNEFNVSPVDRYAYLYGTNQALSPEVRAIINAVGASQFQELNPLPDNMRDILNALANPTVQEANR